MTLLKTLSIHVKNMLSFLLRILWLHIILSKYFYNYWCSMMALSSQNMLYMWYWITANLSCDWWFLHYLLYIPCHNRLYKLQLIQNSIKTGKLGQKLKLMCSCGHKHAHAQHSDLCLLFLFKEEKQTERRIWDWTGIQKNAGSIPGEVCPQTFVLTDLTLQPLSKT